MAELFGISVVRGKNGFLSLMCVPLCATKGIFYFNKQRKMSFLEQERGRTREGEQMFIVWEGANKFITG